MRTRRFAGVFVLCALCVAAAAFAQPAGVERYAGTWAGTWDGAGSGGFELTLDKTNQGAAVGRVAVTTDGGNYSADLKSIAFDGAKMTAKYDFPLDAGSEVILAATFGERSAKGTWSLRPKGQDSEVAGGSFAVDKK